MLKKVGKIHPNKQTHTLLKVKRLCFFVIKIETSRCGYHHSFVDIIIVNERVRIDAKSRRI